MGSEVAAPVFKSIAEAALSQLDVPQDTPARWPQLASAIARAGNRARNSVALRETLPKDSEHLQAAASPLQTASFSNIAQATFLLIVSRERPVRPAPKSWISGPRVTVPDLSWISGAKHCSECQKLGLELTPAGQRNGRRAESPRACPGTAGNATGGKAIKVVAVI